MPYTFCDHIRCRECGATKTLFYTTRSGFIRQCIKCRRWSESLRRGVYYEANREEILKKDRERYQEKREQMREQQASYYKKNRLRISFKNNNMTISI
jgi:hypothetical protein